MFYYIAKNNKDGEKDIIVQYAQPINTSADLDFPTLYESKEEAEVQMKALSDKNQSDEFTVLEMDAETLNELHNF